MEELWVLIAFWEPSHGLMCGGRLPPSGNDVGRDCCVICLYIPMYMYIYMPLAIDVQQLLIHSIWIRESGVWTHDWLAIDSILTWLTRHWLAVAVDSNVFDWLATRYIYSIDSLLTRSWFERLWLTCDWLAINSPLTRYWLVGLMVAKSSCLCVVISCEWLDICLALYFDADE